MSFFEHVYGYFSFTSPFYRILLLVVWAHDWVSWVVHIVTASSEYIKFHFFLSSSFHPAACFCTLSHLVSSRVCFLSVNAMWATVSGSLTPNYEELWHRINPFFLKLLLSRVFWHSNRKRDGDKKQGSLLSGFRFS